MFVKRHDKKRRPPAETGQLQLSVDEHYKGDTGVEKAYFDEKTTERRAMVSSSFLTYSTKKKKTPFSTAVSQKRVDMDTSSRGKTVEEVSRGQERASTPSTSYLSYPFSCIHIKLQDSYNQYCAEKWWDSRSVHMTTDGCPHATHWSICSRMDPRGPPCGPCIHGLRVYTYIAKPP
jgi:hypothetical protein